MGFLGRFFVELALYTALALAVVLMSGCITGGGYSTRDKLLEATHEYSDGVRWGRLEQASLHVPAGARHGFVEKHQALEDELQIAECELVDLTIDSKNERATARFAYVWTLKRHGLVEKTTTEQTWERKSGDWLIAREVRVKGAPLSLFEETAAEK
jgi:hypothetical protein